MFIILLLTHVTRRAAGHSCVMTITLYICAVKQILKCSNESTSINCEQWKVVLNVMLYLRAQRQILRGKYGLFCVIFCTNYFIKSLKDNQATVIFYNISEIFWSLVRLAAHSHAHCQKQESSLGEKKAKPQTQPFCSCEVRIYNTHIFCQVFSARFAEDKICVLKSYFLCSSRTKTREVCAKQTKSETIWSKGWVRAESEVLSLKQWCWKRGGQRRRRGKELPPSELKRAGT